MKRFFLIDVHLRFITYKYIHIVGVNVLHKSEEDKLAHTFIKIQTAAQSLQDFRISFFYDTVGWARVEIHCSFISLKWYEGDRSISFMWRHSWIHNLVTKRKKERKAYHSLYVY